MTETTKDDRGEAVLRVMPRLADINANGHIFGGWVLSQMDIAGGVAAQQRASGRVATVAVDAMTFHRPVFIGDILCCYTAIDRVGRTSITIRIEAWAQRRDHSPRVLVTEGTYTFAAIDENRRPRPVDPEI